MYGEKSVAEDTKVDNIFAWSVFAVIVECASILLNDCLISPAATVSLLIAFCIKIVGLKVKAISFGAHLQKTFSVVFNTFVLYFTDVTDVAISLRLEAVTTNIPSSGKDTPTLVLSDFLTNAPEPESK